MKFKKFVLNILIIVALLTSVLLPVGAQAQSGCYFDDATGTWSPPNCGNTSGSINNIGDLVVRLQNILNSLLPLLVSLGVVYMVFGIVQYVIGDAEEAKKKGRDRIVSGLIGLAVIVGLWGLVSIVVTTFELNKKYTFDNPANVITQNQAAQPGGGLCDLEQNPKFQHLLGYVGCIIAKSVIPLIFIFALAAFTWGVVQFVILGAGEEAKKEQGRQFMIWGVIALTVMVSVWGLVRILGDTFEINTGFIPQVKGRP